MSAEYTRFCKKRFLPRRTVSTNEILDKQRKHRTSKKVDSDRLPIRTIDFDNPADVAMHDKMVELVDEILKLHEQLPDLGAEGRRVAEMRIERTDWKIDELVYRLYGLSEDEIAIVERR